MKKALLTVALTVLAFGAGYSQTGEERLHGTIVGERTVSDHTNPSPVKIYLIQGDDMTLIVESVATTIYFGPGDGVEYTLMAGPGKKGSVKAVNLGRP